MKVVIAQINRQDNAVSIQHPSFRQAMPFGKNLITLHVIQINVFATRAKFIEFPPN